MRKPLVFFRLIFGLHRLNVNRCGKRCQLLVRFFFLLVSFGQECDGLPFFKQPCVRTHASVACHFVVLNVLGCRDQASVR